MAVLRKSSCVAAIVAMGTATTLFAAPAAAWGPLGDEFHVSTWTLNDQAGTTAAMNAAGEFVVAWASAYQDGSGYGVYAQRYSASGVAQGAEFQVNSYTTGHQLHPSAAMDSSGNFVITWRSDDQDGYGSGVYAQRYNASGVAQGSEFRVNTYVVSSQLSPSVAMDSVGNFVIAWHSFGQDGSSGGIYAQRYDALGAPQGSEFQVNTYTASDQSSAAVAMASAGDFVVAWHSLDQDGSGYGIYGQRYDASGIPQGGEFQVNTYTTGFQTQPMLAMDSSGNFVIVWPSDGQDGSGDGVYAQRYDALGVPQGGEFRVNTYTTGYQSGPSVAMSPLGEFTVAWYSEGVDDPGRGIYAQRYDASGAPQGGEFHVNTYTTDDQSWPAVAMNSSGGLVIAWQSSGQDGGGFGIYAQRYGEAPLPLNWAPLAGVLLAVALTVAARHGATAIRS